MWEDREFCEYWECRGLQSSNRLIMNYELRIMNYLNGL